MIRDGHAKSLMFEYCISKSFAGSLDRVPGKIIIATVATMRNRYTGDQTQNRRPDAPRDRETSRGSQEVKMTQQSIRKWTSVQALANVNG
jgi:hypothetical protein